MTGSGKVWKNLWIAAALLVFAHSLETGGRAQTLPTRSRAAVHRAEARVPAVSNEALDPQPGDPLPGITAEEFERFRVGLDDFLEVENAGEGLGPAFNGLGCAQCHAVPAIGGVSPVATTRVGFVDDQGAFEVLGGDTLYQLFALPNQECQPRIPPRANVISRRIPIPLFGAGLVEAIADETIVALEDSEDQDSDGISGRATVVVDVASGEERVGRFGWKAQHATLLVFGADAYRNEMGITNDLFRSETAPGVDPEALALCDPVPDPEDSREPLTGMRGIDAFEAFMRFLAPVRRGPVDNTVTRGEQIFRSIGCASCHVPMLMTGPNQNPVFDRKPVYLYSDLLLHEVGTGDGIPQASAQANEIRTPALWGLRFRRPLLHDGSAATPHRAIMRHGGEAQRVTDNYNDLPPEDQKALLAFLGSL